MSKDMEWFQTQLALAHWHLDGAISTAADAARHHRDSAQEIYTRVLNSLSRANLAPEERMEIQRRMGALSSRLKPSNDHH